MLGWVGCKLMIDIHMYTYQRHEDELTECPYDWRYRLPHDLFDDIQVNAAPEPDVEYHHQSRRHANEHFHQRSSNPRDDHAIFSRRFRFRNTVFREAEQQV